MITLRPQDTVHKAHLLRVLTEIVDNQILSSSLYFKGGTCASMIGILDRFSVDLDFDLKAKSDEKEIRSEFHKIFKKLGYEIDQESKKALEFFLKYPSPANDRNTLKIDALNFIVKSNTYRPIFLAEINRTVNCQDEETIFANKLVAVKDRFDHKQKIAGRDIYDIHHFFSLNLNYNHKVVVERSRMSVLEYLIFLRDFIEKNVTQTLLDQDLNTLLPVATFSKIRKYLKNETIMFLNNEISLLRSKEN